MPHQHSGGVRKMWSTMMPYQLTLGGVLERAGRLFGNAEIVSRRPDGSVHRYAYSECYRRARALAEVLQGIGLKRGERVGTLMYNHSAHLEAYFGIAAMGGVTHTLNLRLHPNDLSYIINHAQDRFLIIDDQLIPTVNQFRDRIDCERIIAVPTTGEKIPAPYVDYEKLIGESHGNFLSPSLHENEAAVMCYTSGTAGSPKGIVYSHRSLVLHAMTISLPDYVALSQRDVVFPVVPFYHANAWGLPIAATLFGCKQVFNGSHTEAESILDLFDAEHVTLSAGVPTVWNGVLQSLEQSREKWHIASGARAIVSGAAPSEALVRGLDAFGIRLLQAWGLIETNATATFSSLAPELENAPEDQRYAARMTQGRPMPFVETRVIGDMGEVPADGSTLGEVQVRGSWVTASYYNLPELRAKWTDDGWFRTGDIVTVNEHGYLRLADRAKDLIRSGDDWISSVDMENAIMGHPAVHEAAVIAVPHPKWQERPLAIVVLKNGEQAQAEDLREFLAKKFARWQVPDAFVFTQQLPHTPTGKLLKKELRKQYKGWKWESETGAAGGS